MNIGISFYRDSVCYVLGVIGILQLSLTLSPHLSIRISCADSYYRYVFPDNKVR